MYNHMSSKNHDVNGYDFNVNILIILYNLGF